MTPSRKIPLLLALGALLLGPGCGAGDRAPVAAEVDEPSYREGQQLKNQGRSNEALAAFLRVIEKRGEQASPESHLEAGLIYLNNIRDPLEAAHQFRKYLELQPNSKRADLVRGQLENAKRQYALMLHGPNPLEATQPDLQEQIDRLTRENTELKAQLAAASANAGSAFVRLPRVSAEVDPAGGGITPPAAAPPVVRTTDATVALAPPPPQPAAGGGSIVFQPPVKPPGPGPAAKPATGAPAGRTHVVQPGEGLFGIAKKYYGTGSMARVQAIYEANRDVMKSESDLRPGMELKIP